ncbi:MAG: beta-1,6-N-acetylglucosaminyltransferase [Rikenellaceae bacterium]
MKIAILIQVHINPEQVRQLCDRLRHPEVDVFLSVDAKVNRDDFKSCGADILPTFVKVGWGDFSQIKATLEALKCIKSYEHIVFISGQDWPLKPIDEIVKFFNQPYLCCRILEQASPMHKRYKYRYVSFGSKIFRKIANKLIRIFTLSPRKFFFTGDVYKGSQWWCVSGECAKYILRFCDENPEYVRFFKHTHCADELFFHNIVARSPFAESHIKPESEHFTFTIWEKNSANPKILTLSDLDAILGSKKIFARKVDITVDSALISTLCE